MGFRNAQTPSGSEVVVAGSGPVDYVGLEVITASDLVYVDSQGNTTTLTAGAGTGPVPAGMSILCRIVKVTTASGAVLGLKP